MLSTTECKDNLLLAERDPHIIEIQGKIATSAIENTGLRKSKKMSPAMICSIQFMTLAVFKNGCVSIYVTYLFLFASLYRTKSLYPGASNIPRFDVHGC